MDFIDMSAPSLKEMVLYKLQRWHGIDISNHEFEVEEIRDHALDRVCYRIHHSIMGSKATEEYEVEFEEPINLWQYTKRYLPNWFTKRYPVKNNTIIKKIKVDCRAVFPELPSIEDRFVIRYFQELNSEDGLI